MWLLWVSSLWIVDIRLLYGYRALDSGPELFVDLFADKDYDRIVDDIIPDRGPEVTFGLERHMLTWFG